MPGIRIIYNTYFIRKTFGNIGAHAILLIPDLGVSYEIFRPLIGKLEAGFTSLRFKSMSQIIN